MLSREALESALPLALKFDALNLKLEPVDQSPLAALVCAARSGNELMVVSGQPVDMGVGMGQQTVYEPDLGTMAYLANCPDANGVIEHDLVLDDVGQFVGESVLGHLNVARNVVGPLVLDLAERTMKSLEEINASALLGVEVVVCDAPIPLTNSMLESSFAKYETEPFMNLDLLMRLPDFTAAELREWMMTGTARLDSDIAEWLGGLGDTFLVTLWEKAFQGKVENYRTFQDLCNEPERGEDNLLAVHLLARRLCDDIPEGIEMNSNLFEQQMVDLRNQSGLRLGQAVERYKNNVKNGLLVKAIDSRCTVVYGDVFRAWIEQGGSIEVLYGNMLKAPGLVTVAQLNEQADALKLAWDQHSALVESVESTRKFQRTKEYFTAHFRAQLSEDSDETTRQAEHEIFKRFEDVLLDLTEKDLLDPYDCALKLVCRSRFCTTSAEDILRGVQLAKKENPNLDMREAATVATIRYIATWVASMFKVSGC